MSRCYSPYQRSVGVLRSDETTREQRLYLGVFLEFLRHLWPTRRFLTARRLEKFNDQNTRFADCIVAESNNGGDLVESNIRNLEPNINFKQVRATRGKILRAEPISALYEQGKVSHLQRFPELEEQMTSYTGTQGEESPDRLDALVWALTELSSNPTQEMEIIMV